MAQILRRTAGRFVANFRQQAPPQVQSTLAKLSVCRTAALGERRYKCSQCEAESLVYHSCGDRHCPVCSGAKRRTWMDSVSQLILPGVIYYQVVFTLPSDLSSLALGNRREIYDLLFRSAWMALKSTVRDEQLYDPAAAMVLHTWNQRLDAHAHVHAVVPGGGPALDGTGWRCSLRDGDPDSAGRYLVKVEELRDQYREAFLRGLKRLRDEGELKLTGEFAHLNDDQSWQTFISKLRSSDWVTHIEAPPRKDNRVENVLKYLARYLTGAPISDSRIVSADDQEVTFLAREGTKSGGNREQILVPIPTVEFTRRWALHILPKGYTKTRRFGGWSNTRRADYLQRCRTELAAIDALLDPQTEDEGASEQVDELSLMPACHGPCQCGAALILQEEIFKPSWSAVMNSSDRPAWYQRL